MSRHAKSLIGLFLIHQFIEVEVIIRLCCALALLPQNLLQRGLNIIGTEALNMDPFVYDILRPFLVYVQHDWLDHANRGRTLSVCGSYHRTNNARYMCFSYQPSFLGILLMYFLSEYKDVHCFIFQ